MNLFFRLLALALLIPISACFQKRESRQNQNTSTHAFADGIIGGQDAEPNEFPYLANIWIESPEDQLSAHLCGGSLIHPKWILTAAHCVTEDISETKQGPIAAKKLSVIFGSHTISGQGGRKIMARSVHPHPQFSWPHYDVALIELTEAITDIQPILLASQDLDFSKGPQWATVVGWGLIDADGKQDAEMLQKLNLPVISREKCSADPFPKSRGWKIESDTLCAQTQQNQKASCHGDSGGPLIQIQSGVATQIGIVSWGSACSGGRFQSDVEAYAAVSIVVPWILSLIQ